MIFALRTVYKGCKGGFSVQCAKNFVKKTKVNDEKNEKPDARAKKSAGESFLPDEESIKTDEESFLSGACAKSSDEKSFLSEEKEKK